MVSGNIMLRTNLNAIPATRICACDCQNRCTFICPNLPFGVRTCGRRDSGKVDPRFPCLCINSGLSQGRPRKFDLRAKRWTWMVTRKVAELAFGVPTCPSATTRNFTQSIAISRMPRLAGHCAWESYEMRKQVL